MAPTSGVSGDGDEIGAGALSGGDESDRDYIVDAASSYYTKVYRI